MSRFNTPMDAQTHASTPGRNLDIELLSIEDLQELMRLSRSKIYQLIREDDFPSPVKIGVASRWRRQKVRSWLDAAEAKQACARCS